MEVYNKLIRDNIDTIINNNGNGEIAVTRILDDEEYKKELMKKLEEEVEELKEAIVTGIDEDIIEESADLIEVIRAVNKDNLDLVIKTLEDKRSKRGGFTERKYLEIVKKVSE